MSEQRSISDEWATFVERCIPADATKDQIKNVKLTFFAGSVAAVKIIIRRLRQRATSLEVLTFLESMEGDIKEFLDEV